MATHNTGWKYAKNVHAQINPNQPKRITWKYTSNAVGKNDKYTYSSYTVKNVKGKNNKTTTVKNYPYDVTAHNFNLDIPKNAYIKKVEFQVNMKITNKKAKVDFPRAVMCIYGGGWSKHIDNTKSRETGWHSGLYMINPRKDMTTSFTIKSYVMNEADVIKGKFTASNFNAMAMGVDLVFDDLAEVSCDVYLKWVRVKVWYDIPEYTLTHDGVDTSKSKPRKIKTGRQYSVKYILKQGTKAKGGDQSFKLNVPFGTEIVSTTTTKGKFNNNTWTVNPDGVSKGVSLTVKYKDYTVNKQKITLKGVKTKDFWYESSYGNAEDYAKGTVQVDSNNTPHQKNPLCFVAVTKAESSLNNQVQFTLHTAGFEYETLGSQDNLLNVEIDPNSTDNGVELLSSTNNTIIFTIPEDKPTDIAFRFCLKPTTGTNGDVYLSVGNLNTSHAKFEIKPPYEYHFTTNNQTEDEEHNISNNLLVKDKIIFSSHRIASRLETGAYILPCAVKEHDAVMIQGKANIHMYKWEDVDYIGCIPLEHHHFDPKSTYKDKLLDSRSKNNRYLGKELASDEDITLNVRLRPHQVTTLQGLIDMDKPIPINANHKCFEGDALNHRGWAEIYGVQTEYTNPHWYKCDIDVKYLTHNLNTRFKINRGNRTFNSYPIPSLLTQTVNSGDSIGDNRDTDLFLLETDGGYIYNPAETTIDTWVDELGNSVIWNGDETTYTYTNEDNESVTLEGDEIISHIELLGNVIDTPVIGEPLKVTFDFDADETHRNMVTLDEGQYVLIRSRNLISTQCQISLNWSSSKLSENKENAISRITRLIDKDTKNAVFEYEYSDFDFSNYSEAVDVEHQTLTGSLSCHVTGRKLVKGDYIEELNKDIDIHIELDDSDNIEEEDEQSYGSNLTFSLNGNKLTVEDTGFNGKEIHQEFELEGSRYYWETEWRNNNTDASNADITAYFDIVCNDSLISSKFAVDYSKLYISPFPVPDKKILFTRNGEEGVIYYLQDNKEEFSYLVDPYYQYHNGVDLRTSEGTSILNLNYGYKIIYLQNGLVSLGINRLNGQMYLAKYDPISKEYIETHVFQLTNYDDMNINSISDDKIVLQVSNTTISMYRGHPYVIIKHPLEDIQIVSKFNKIWGETVGNEKSQYPLYFDLLNSSNLLPECIGGTNGIAKSCITGREVETNLIEGNINVISDESIYQSVSTIFNVNGDLEQGDIVHFLINGDEVGQVTYPNPFSYTFDKGGAYEVTAVYVGNNNRSYIVSPNITVHVQKVVPSSNNNSSSGGNSSLKGEWKLTMTSPKTFHYLDNAEISFTLTKGNQRVKGQTIERMIFTKTVTGDTDKNGKCSIKNNNTLYHPKNYKIGAKLHVNGKFVTSVWKNVTIKKADTEWEIVHGARGRNDKTFTAQLKNKHSGKGIAGKKVVVYVNGKKYNKKTNKNGNISLKMKSGSYTYKLSFAGDKDYNKSNRNYKERVVK